MDEDCFQLKSLERVKMMCPFIRMYAKGVIQILTCFGCSHHDFKNHHSVNAN